MKNFERMMNFFTGRGIFILITSIILLVVAVMMRMLVFIFFGVIGFLTGFMDTCICIGNRKRKQMIARLEENEGFYG